MARLRQQHPSNYGSSQRISDEFESLIRYLVAAEYGNKTLSELMALVFDENGTIKELLEIRKDSSNGLEYRAGSYPEGDTTSGWVQIIANSEIRGEPGVDVGEIGAPLLFGRANFTATAAQTVFDYAHTDADDLLVYVNGTLQRPGALADYTSDPDLGDAGRVTFTSGLELNDLVSIFKVRSSAVSNYRRQDTLTSATQTVFPFVHTPEEKLVVFRNGILQREGGSFDYVANSDTDTVTFTSSIPSDELITIITVENNAVQRVTGMMFEADFVDPATGLVLFNKIQIADDQILPAKVDGLPAALTSRPKVTVSSSAPSAPAEGEFWIDTSFNPAVLKFRQSTNWLQASPSTLIPSFTEADALKILRVNGSANAYELANLDLSSVIPLSQKAAANGVSPLDADSRVPAANAPLVSGRRSLYLREASASNATYNLQRFYKEKLRITGISVQTASGSCTIQLSINGVLVGTTYSVSSTTNNADINPPLEIDALASTRLLSVVVTSATAPSTLEVTIAAEALTA